MLICHQLGNRSRLDHQEFGRADIDVKGCALFGGLLQPGDAVWMSHGDRIEAAPPGFKVMATSAGAPFATERGTPDLRRSVPSEVVHTPR